MLLKNEFTTFTPSELSLHHLTQCVPPTFFLLYLKVTDVQTVTVLLEYNSHATQFTDLRCKFSDF